MTDMIRYFGGPIAYGPNGNALPDDTELVVTVATGLIGRMPAAMMTQYGDGPAYPVGYTLAHAA